ncbi:MAK10-like protein [Tanacetum coccineum]
MASQDARLSKFEADFKQQQSKMAKKIDTILKAITDQLAGSLLSNTVKNPKLNTSLVLFARSYPTKDPQCLSRPSTSINAIKTYSKEANISQTSQLQPRMNIGTQQPEEPKLTLKDEFQDLHLNLPHSSKDSAKIDDPELFSLPYRLGDSKPFDTLADLESSNETKSYPIEIVKDVEVNIGKLILLNDFYVIKMKKDHETPLLIGKGFLATSNAVIDCRMAKIAVGEGITRSVFGVKGVDLGEEEVPYWTTLGKKESYKRCPNLDGVDAQIPYYARKDFLDCHFP